jgi:hypothetical protein
MSDALVQTLETAVEEDHFTLSFLPRVRQVREIVQELLVVL